MDTFLDFNILSLETTSTFLGLEVFSIIFFVDGFLTSKASPHKLGIKSS